MLSISQGFFRGRGVANLLMSIAKHSLRDKRGPGVGKLIACVLYALSFLPVGAQPPVVLDENTTVSILNRSARVKPDGTWRIDNVPANFGPVRVRATRVKDGVTTTGQSDFVDLQANVLNGFSPFLLGGSTQIPTKLTLSSALSTLTSAGQTSPVTVVATYPDTSVKNVSAGGEGTTYTVSNPAVATISPDGLVTAVSSGTILVSANNDGAMGIIRIEVVTSGDTDGDGLSNDLEIANGLNPNDPVDAFEDPDMDGLTNREELVTHGTDRLLRDSDADGLSDGEEVLGTRGTVTDALLPDTDGDGVNDLLEFQTGSDPTDRTSINLADALESLEVTPLSFVLTVNTIIGEASRQLAVTGSLRDGNSIDLTTTGRFTNYTSSNLAVANFGTPDGRVFAGENGTATITVTNSGFSRTVLVTVRTTSPSALSSVTIPGFANSVAVNGNYAYIAAGAAGLQVVDVTDRRNPRVIGALDTPGNANDVRVVGNLVYIADGTAGLQIINVATPSAPAVVGSINTPGEAWDVAVAGTRAYVADGPSGLQVLDISSPAAPRIVGSVDTLGTAKGVDVSGARAVIADGPTGLQVVDVSDATRPNIVGSLSYNGDARDVVLSGNFAYVADFNTSFTSIDITDPLQPILRASTPLNTVGRLQNLAVAGRFALGAAVDFANSIPIVDVGQPANPIARALLAVTPVQGDQGHGITVDSSFVYLAAVQGSSSIQNGINGTSRLYIGQYQAIDDTRGISPQVAITNPLDGSVVVEGETITVSVEATDDVEVASVSLRSNGIPVGVDTVIPYEFSLTVPTGMAFLDLTAEATDFGNNTASSPGVLLSVVPDPGTTVLGWVVDAAGNRIAGAQVSIFGDNTITTASDGSFTVDGVSTIRGNIIANASSVVNGVLLAGSSASVIPVRGGLTDVGDIIITEAFFETQYGASLAQCDDCWVQVDLPFDFVFFGTVYRSVFFDGNGRVSFGFGSEDFSESIGELSDQPIVSAFWNDWDARTIPGSGIFYNGALPGRAVFTWLQMPEYIGSVTKPRVTFQITLFQDGRVQFGYNGINVPFGVIGISAGPGSTQQVVDFSAQPTFSFSGRRTVAEQFTGSFDLDRSFITWTPNAFAGYDVRVLSRAPEASTVDRAARTLAAPTPAPASVVVVQPKPATLVFVSRAGVIYSLQSNASSTPGDGNWQTIQTPITGDGRMIELALPPSRPGASTPRYRVIPAPSVR